MTNIIVSVNGGVEVVRLVESKGWSAEDDKEETGEEQ